MNLVARVREHRLFSSEMYMEPKLDGGRYLAR
jgi:hypothetical protein